MMGLPVMSLRIGLAPVGLGRAAWTQPLLAQDPHAMTKRAFSAVYLN